MINVTKIVLCLSLLPLIIISGTDSQIKNAQNQIHNISASAFVVNNTLLMKVRWKATLREGTKLDVTVLRHEGHYCYPHIYPLIEVSKDIDEIILPRNETYHPDDDRSIKPGCNYTIKVRTFDTDVEKSMVYLLPDCIESICSCKHSSLLPKVDITKGELISPNSVKVEWFLPVNISRISLLAKERLNRVIIRVFSGHGNSNKEDFPFKLNVNNRETRTIRGSKIISIKTAIKSGEQIKILAFVEDTLKCTGRATKFLINVPSTTDGSISTISLTIVLPTLLLLIASAYIGHCICKNYKRTKSPPQWMSVYRSECGGEIRAITMEENPMYSKKDSIDKSVTDIYEIPHQNITIGAKLGSGAFGVVYSGVAKNLVCSPGLTVVAVKELKKKPTQDELEEFHGEIQTMKNAANHENVVALLGCCTIREPLWLIMELVRHGNLLEYLRKVRKKHIALMKQQPTEKPPTIEKRSLSPLLYLDIKHSTLSAASEQSYISQPGTNRGGNIRPSMTETMYTLLSQHSNIEPSLDYVVDNNELHNFAVQISRGMRHLEKKGITHRDLAARNILIGEGKILKISDFGMSRSGVYVNTKMKKVPYRWLSIEAIRDNLYSNKSDVWAFGIVLWEIGTLGGFPYPFIPIDENQRLFPFLAAGQRLGKPDICSEPLYQLMLQCWLEDPNDRPSFREIVDWLQPQKEKVYIEFSSLSPDYVFPPTREQIMKNGKAINFGDAKLES